MWAVCLCASTFQRAHQCASEWVHVCALKLINKHNWRLPVIWRWGQRKLFCGTLIILVRTLGYKYCQRYTLYPAFLSVPPSLHPSPKWKTRVLQENKNKISMQGVVFRFFFFYNVPRSSLLWCQVHCKEQAFVWKHTWPKKASNYTKTAVYEFSYIKSYALFLPFPGVTLRTKCHNINTSN